MISKTITALLGTVCILLTASCDAPPEYLEIAGDPPKDLAAPSLLPIDEVLAVAQRPVSSSTTPDDNAAIEARAAALQARAGELSSAQVVDDATRADMEQALERRTNQ